MKWKAPAKRNPFRELLSLLNGLRPKTSHTLSYQETAGESIELAAKKIGLELPENMEQR